MGPALSRRRTSVQPEGGAIATDEGVTANTGLTRNPHTFLTGILTPPLAMQIVGLQAQAQIANFFASDGSDTIDPDGPGPLFESPIVLPLPETLNYIP